jgi:hypothetical protein
MARHKDGILIAICVAAGLAMVSLHGQHPSIGPMGWANASGRTVGIGFMAHMVELEFRRVVAAVGTVITIR